MFSKTWTFLRELVYDEGKPSRTGFIGIGGFFVGVFGAFAGTIYSSVASFLGHPWADYKDWLNYCLNMSGLGGIVQGANKFINAKYNSAPGCSDVRQNPPTGSEAGGDAK